jgi:D-alanyl-D-alanine carboxypeptidase
VEPARQEVARAETTIARQPAAPAARPAAPQQTGWIIQVGATDDEGKAKDILADARSKSRGTLGKASPFTEKVVRDGTTLFRARFAGFEEADDAQAACKALKRSGMACFAARL